MARRCMVSCRQSFICSCLLATSTGKYIFVVPILYFDIKKTFQGQTIDDIPTAVIEDAAQLVKANSISGNKLNNVDVVYTMWENLKKTAGMDVGQVSFHRDKDVRKIRVEKRINDIVNRLNKTKTEGNPDFRAEREKRDADEREDKKKLMRNLRDQEKENERRRKEEQELRSYSSLMAADKMTSNHDDGNDSDDFM